MKYLLQRTKEGKLKEDIMKTMILYNRFEIILQLRMPLTERHLGVINACHILNHSLIWAMTMIRTTKNNFSYAKMESISLSDHNDNVQLFISWHLRVTSRELHTQLMP